MVTAQQTFAEIADVALASGISPGAIDALKNDRATISYPAFFETHASFFHDESVSKAGINFRSAAGYCFFSALKEILTERCGNEGTGIGNLLAALSIVKPDARREQPFDASLKELLKDTKLVSIADAIDVATTRSARYAARWGVSYSNVGNVGVASTVPDAQDFIGIGFVAQTGCDRVWACNVISRVGIHENRASSLSQDLLIYQTLASAVTMLKPQTGKLTCINQYDPRAHVSLTDTDFHQWMDVATARPDTNTFEYRRRSDKTLTALDFCRWYGNNEQRIDAWPSF